MDEDDLDINECIPMIDSIVEVLDLDSTNVDFEELLEYVEDTFEYTFDKRRFEIMDLIKERIIEFRDHVTRRVISEHTIVWKRRAFINDLLEEDGFTQKNIKTSNDADGAMMIEVDEKLRDIVGKNRMTKCEFFQRFWDYLDKNNLFDVDSEEQINCDEKLSKLFGEKILRHDLENRLSKFLTKVKSSSKSVIYKAFSENYSESESESGFETENDIKNKDYLEDNDSSWDENDFSRQNLAKEDNFSTFRTDISTESDSESETEIEGSNVWATDDVDANETNTDSNYESDSR